MPRIAIVSVVASVVVAAAAGASGQAHAGAGPPVVALDNARVRVLVVRSSGASAGIDHGPGVVVPLEDSPAREMGDAFWAADLADASAGAGPRALVVPKKGAAPAPAPAAASKPGDAPFTGMSFKTLFENDTVTIIRARMEKGAREGFHTHASDTIVVHLSGGAIEDTADGTTRVNRWKHGDVEFEGRGSSHSARNVGDPVDVVLVTLK